MGHKLVVKGLRKVIHAAMVAALLPTVTPLVGHSQDIAQPQIKDLGDDRYQIGEILINKSTRTFTVPGTVLQTETPLEYVAVTVGGMKGYESLLELKSSAVEFNLACILIGLDNTGLRLPEFQFDEKPVVGPRVAIRAAWRVGDEAHDVPVEQLLTLDGVPGPESQWTYLGSFQEPDAGYIAEVMGTLIGFVHDPAAIIEHGAGLGIGAYGAVAGNEKLLPEAGHPITLTVRALPAD